MLHFIPKDPISKQLLKSIPKKFVAWLENIGYDQIDEGTFGDLSWRVDLDKSWITVMSIGLTISWSGPSDAPSWIASSDPVLESIPDDMEYFVGIEQTIYDELEKLEKAHAKQ